MSDEEARDTIAFNVVRLLQARGWSQYRLAQESGESEMNVSRVVRASNMPGVGLLTRLAEAFEVEFSELLRPIPRRKKKTKKVLQSA